MTKLMTARAWFVVGVRLFGVWLLIGCLSELITLVQVTSGMIVPRTGPPTAPIAYGFHAAVYLLAAGLLLWGAVPLSSLFDWRIEPKPDESARTEGSYIEQHPESSP